MNSNIIAGICHRVRDNSLMARRTRSTRDWTGLYYARQARGMSRSELVRLSGISKQQLSRLENGQIKLRLDHLKPFASHLGYTPEQILLWGRFPGTGSKDHASGNIPDQEVADGKSLGVAAEVPELDTQSRACWQRTCPGNPQRGASQRSDKIRAMDISRKLCS